METGTRWRRGGEIVGRDGWNTNRNESHFKNQRRPPRAPDTKQQPTINTWLTAHQFSTALQALLTPNWCTVYIASWDLQLLVTSCAPTILWWIARNLEKQFKQNCCDAPWQSTTWRFHRAQHLQITYKKCRTRQKRGGMRVTSSQKSQGRFLSRDYKTKTFRVFLTLWITSYAHS